MMRPLPIRSIDVAALGPLPDAVNGEFEGKSLIQYAAEFAGFIGFVALVCAFVWRAL